MLTFLLTFTKLNKYQVLSGFSKGFRLLRSAEKIASARTRLSLASIFANEDARELRFD